ncbi:MAG TPA: DUF2723 domain-containing protein [Elusimicrobiota bacterium]|nr:DUF2723 domain-containing protein [Elusimicrobiota bacterium]
MLEPILIFLGFFAAGLWSAAPSVTFGDAGEYAASVAALGLPHAPGYPIYVLMSRALGTFLAAGNWAYRTNVFSALCGALALAIFVNAAKRAGLSRPARLFAALVLGCCVLWRYESAVTEVFALHMLFAAAAIWVVFRFREQLWGDKPMAAAGLVFGLGMANHQTIVLIFPALAAELWISAARTSPALTPMRDFTGSVRYGDTRAALQRISHAAVVFGLFFVLGLCAYIYLPVRAAHVPPLDWDQPTTWARFWHMFFRRDYGSFSLTVQGAQTRGVRAWALQLARYGRYSLRELGWPAAALSAIGAAAWTKLKLRSSLAFPLLILFIAGPFFLMLGNPPFDAQTSSALQRFYLASWLGAALLAGAGVEALEMILPRAAGRAAAWALCLCPLLAAFGSAGAWNERGDFASYDYGRAILHSLPPGSSLYMDGGDDTFYSLAFLTRAEGLRPDVDLHDRGGLVFANPYGPDFLDLPKEMKESRRDAVESALARTGRLYYATLNPHILPGFVLNPAGLLYHPAAKAGGAAVDQALWAIYPERWEMSLLQNHYRDRDLVAFYPVMRAADLAARGDFPQAITDLEETWLLAPDALWTQKQVVYQLEFIAYDAAQKSLWPQAQGALELARAVYPGDADVLCNLGVAYEHLGRPKTAEALYLEATAKNLNWAEAYYDLGELYWKQKRWKEAAAALSQASRLVPGNATWANFARGAAFRAARAGQ